LCCVIKIYYQPVEFRRTKCKGTVVGWLAVPIAQTVVAGHGLARMADLRDSSVTDCDHNGCRNQRRHSWRPCPAAIKAQPTIGLISRRGRPRDARSSIEIFPALQAANGPGSSGFSEPGLCLPGGIGEAPYCHAGQTGMQTVDGGLAIGARHGAVRPMAVAIIALPHDPLSPETSIILTRRLAPPLLKVGMITVADPHAKGNRPTKQKDVSPRMAFGKAMAKAPQRTSAEMKKGRSTQWEAPEPSRRRLRRRPRSGCNECRPSRCSLASRW